MIVYERREFIGILIFEEINVLKHFSKGFLKIEIFSDVINSCQFSISFKSEINEIELFPARDLLYRMDNRIQNGADSHVENPGEFGGQFTRHSPT